MVDLGAGSDSLTLGNGGNTLTVVNVETLTAGTGNDAVTLGNAVTAGSLDFGAGNDKLTLAAGGNTITVANVGDRHRRLRCRRRHAVHLDLGPDRPRRRRRPDHLADVRNTVTIANVETIVGGASIDLVTLGSAITSGTIDLGDGATG